jgi:hypothetical protein
MLCSEVLDYGLVMSLNSAYSTAEACEFAGYVAALAIRPGYTKYKYNKERKKQVELLIQLIETMD